MPYRISREALTTLRSRPEVIKALTNYQQEVLHYLANRYGDGHLAYIYSHDIGYDLKLHPRAVSGIAYSLWKKGLVDKGD